MDITAFIMGICPPHRIRWLKETVDYMDSQSFPFSNKIMAIGEFDNYYFPKDINDYFVNNGWKILIDNYRNRIKSTERVLSETQSEFVFYNEDDVMAALPDSIDVESIFNTKSFGRSCGMISMTLGGSVFDPECHNIGDLLYIEDMVLLKNKKYIIFERIEDYRNDWFFEFPGLFIRTDLFKSCVNYVNKNLYGMQIEMALTKAWFDLKLHTLYYKASLCRPDALEILLEDQMKVNSHCRLLKNLDPNQGNCMYSHY